MISSHEPPAYDLLRAEASAPYRADETRAVDVAAGGRLTHARGHGRHRAAPQLEVRSATTSRSMQPGPGR